MNDFFFICQEFIYIRIVDETINYKFQKEMFKKVVLILFTNNFMSLDNISE